MAPLEAWRMQQQPVAVLALGSLLAQDAREPAMGYPNNALYPGQAVGVGHLQP